MGRAKRQSLCEDFWGHLAAGELRQAQHAFVQWETLALCAEEKAGAHTVSSEILMLSAVGKHEASLSHALDEEEAVTLIATCPQEFADASLATSWVSSWALACFAEWALGEHHTRLNAMNKVCAHLPSSVRDYLYFYAHFVCAQGLVPERFFAEVRALYPDDYTPVELPALPTHLTLFGSAPVLAHALRVLSMKTCSVRLREQTLIQLDNLVAVASPRFGAEEFLWAPIAFSLMRDTRGEQRRKWCEKTFQLSHHTPQLAIDAAHWLIAHAEPGEESAVLRCAATLPVHCHTLAEDAAVHRDCEKWVRRAQELERGETPDKHADIATRTFFDLGRLAYIRKDWVAAWKFMVRSIQHHSELRRMMTMSSILLDALQEEPDLHEDYWDALDEAIAEALAQDEENPDTWYRLYRWAAATKRTGEEATCLNQLTYSLALYNPDRLCESIEPFTLWIELYRSYTAVPYDALENKSLLWAYPWFVWALCEDPHATIGQFQYALSAYENLQLANNDNASLCWELTFAQLLVAYRAGDVETVLRLRNRWRIPPEYRGQLLREVESLMFIDMCVGMGDHHLAVAGIEESWGGTTPATCVQAYLLESLNHVGLQDQAWAWFDQVTQNEQSFATDVLASQESYFATVIDAGMLRFLASVARPNLRDETRTRTMTLLQSMATLHNRHRIARAATVALRTCFALDEKLPTLIDAATPPTPTAEQAAAWCEQEAKTTGPIGDQCVLDLGVPVSNIEEIQEIFVRHLHADSKGIFHNHHTGVKQTYLMFDTNNSYLYEGERIHLVEEPDHMDTPSTITIPAACTTSAEELAEKLRNDGYKVIPANNSTQPPTSAWVVFIFPHGEVLAVGKQ